MPLWLALLAAVVLGTTCAFGLYVLVTNRWPWERQGLNTHLAAGRHPCPQCLADGTVIAFPDEVTLRRHLDTWHGRRDHEVARDVS